MQLLLEATIYQMLPNMQPLLQTSRTQIRSNSNHLIVLGGVLRQQLSVSNQLRAFDENKKVKPILNFFQSQKIFRIGCDCAKWITRDINMESQSLETSYSLLEAKATTIRRAKPPSTPFSALIRERIRGEKSPVSMRSARFSIFLQSEVIFTRLEGEIRLESLQLSRNTRQKKMR
jgi:hypothetical protein